MAAVHSDESNNLLAADRRLEEPVQRSFLGKSKAGLLVVALGLGALVAILWAAPGARQTPVSLPMHFQGKAWVADSASKPEDALEHFQKRKRMIVEQDLNAVLHIHVSQRQAHYHEKMAEDGAEKCLRQAERLFDEVAEASDLEVELKDEEFMHFRRRFASSMKNRCKDMISERLWLKAAGEELERQKPLVTAAIVEALNKAGLGFEAKMHDWLLEESVATFSSRLGYLPTPEGQKSVLKRKVQTRQASDLPLVFRAELKWPKCKEEILRIHNQGHCGSCWAFGGTASIDARMCIASNGTWDADENILSRLHVTSCAPNIHYEGSDGCQGGWPHWAMEMMAETGIASTKCLPYYIGGEGAEHFEHQDTAPPCESKCQDGYSGSLQSDTFSSAGVANYDWITHVHGDLEKTTRMKDAIYQEGPVAFAFKANHAFMGYHKGVFSVCTGHDQANHAVYAFGWGVVAAEDGGNSVEYIEASNSWGSNWGANGHFRIHPRCITDVTIPGTIESTVVNHTVGTVDTKVPRDPDNEVWPWAKPDECPFANNCVTGKEGAGNEYADNELCVSKRLNGQKIHVVEFDTEKGYDILTVSGKAFSGHVDSELEGLEVDKHGIKFQSDGSMRGAGFKLCMQ